MGDFQTASTTQKCVDNWNVQSQNKTHASSKKIKVFFATHAFELQR
jgi:hypothetical protein